MKRKLFTALAALIVLIGGALILRATQRSKPTSTRLPQDRIALPSPQHTGNTSLEEALLKRRSIRSYRHAALMLAEAAQLLWAAQGVTDERGFRTAPSAGGLYPLETYLVAGQVEGLAVGVYRYDPQTHALAAWLAGDVRVALTAASLGQAYIREAPASLVFAAVYQRTTERYGHRGTTYVHMEAGHASQNVYLQAVSLGLGTVAIGAFEDAEVRRVLALPADEQPLYIMPVGRP